MYRGYGQDSQKVRKGMKIIIDIPKETYNEISESTTIKCGEVFAQKLLKYIKNGIPLEQEPCDDAIRRQAVLDVLDKNKYSNKFCEEHHIDWSINLGMAHIVVNDLPSVNPKERTGHWINSNIPNEEYVCSECGGACWYYDYRAKVAKSKFCPNCGCRMVEP